MYPGFSVYVWATPFVNPASWVALVYVLIEVSNRIFFGPGVVDPSNQGRGIALSGAREE